MGKAYKASSTSVGMKNRSLTGPSSSSAAFGRYSCHSCSCSVAGGASGTTLSPLSVALNSPSVSNCFLQRSGTVRRVGQPTCILLHVANSFGVVALWLRESLPLRDVSSSIHLSAACFSCSLFSWRLHPWVLALRVFSSPGLVFLSNLTYTISTTLRWRKRSHGRSAK